MAGLISNVRDLVQQRMAAPYNPATGGVPTRGMGANINAFNGYMRQQPWYQQWFQRQGLNPNQVHLSDAQRQQLQGVLAQHGYDLSNTDGMNIDPAGNLNNPHGFASQPTWLKALEIGAPIAAGVALTGGVGSLGFLGGGGGAGTGTAATAAGTTAGTSAATAGTLAGIGSGLTKLAPTLIGTGANLYATKTAANANSQAAQLQAKAAADALEYTKQRDALQLAEDKRVSAQNLQLYQDRQNRLAPFINFGTGSVAQLGQPIPGSLGGR